MNWKEALKQLKNGKKIRKPYWNPKTYWTLSKDGYERIVCHNETSAQIHINQLESNDWELVNKFPMVFVFGHRKIELFKDGELNIIDTITNNSIYFNSSIPLLKKALKTRDELFDKQTSEILQNKELTDQIKESEKLENKTESFEIDI